MTTRTTIQTNKKNNKNKQDKKNKKHQNGKQKIEKPKHALKEKTKQKQKQKQNTKNTSPTASKTTNTNQQVQLQQNELANNTTSNANTLAESLLKTSGISFDKIQYVFIDCITTLETRACKLTNMGGYEKLEHKVDRMNTMSQLTLPNIQTVYYCLKGEYFTNLSSNRVKTAPLSEHSMKVVIQNNLTSVTKDNCLIVTYDVKLRSLLTTSSANASAGDVTTLCFKKSIFRKSDAWFSFVRAKSSTLDKQVINEANRTFLNEKNYSLIIDGNNLFYHLLPKIAREDKMRANRICTQVLYAFWKAASKQVQDIIVIYDQRVTEPLYTEEVKSGNSSSNKRKFVVTGPMVKKKTADDEIIRYLQEEGIGKCTYLVTGDSALIGRASHQQIYRGHINCGQLLDVLIKTLSEPLTEIKTKPSLKKYTQLSSDKIERWVLEHLPQWEYPAQQQQEQQTTTTSK